MEHHTVQQINRGAAAGKWVYTGGDPRTRWVQCCADVWLQLADTPDTLRESSPLWAQVGHDTAEDAYAHMRAVLLGRLRLDGQGRDWSGCRAPKGTGRCDVPTKARAHIPPSYFMEALCDAHRTRAQVEWMWEGPGDSFGSG